MRKLNLLIVVFFLIAAILSMLSLCSYVYHFWRTYDLTDWLIAVGLYFGIKAAVMMLGASLWYREGPFS